MAFCTSCGDLIEDDSPSEEFCLDCFEMVNQEDNPLLDNIEEVE